jgi:UDP-glucose:O-linked fucose beta-1,3-glucosyltransferase
LHPCCSILFFAEADFNTVQGHCNKTQSILKHFAKNARQNKWKWLVIADDDTILSVSKLMDAIQCYDKGK